MLACCTAGSLSAASASGAAAGPGQIFATLDKDKDDKLGLDEILDSRLANRLAQPPGAPRGPHPAGGATVPVLDAAQKQAVTDKFNAADANKDGFLDRTEFATLMPPMGPGRRPGAGGANGGAGGANGGAPAPNPQPAPAPAPGL